MSLRDLVAAECAEPNPLARFFNGISSEKRVFPDEWVERDAPSDVGPSRSAFDRLRQRERERAHADEVGDRMLRDVDRNDHFDPLEEERMFESSFHAAHPPDGPLNSLLKSFVTRESLGRMGVPDLGLSMQDKVKIRDRAGVMSKHIYSNESNEFLENQMGNLLDSLRLDDRPGDFEASWHDSQFRRPPPMMHQGDRGNAWADEFSSHREDWADDYNMYMNNIQENKAWIEEHAQRGPMHGPDAWVNDYRNEGNRWADDYATKSDRQLEEEAMDEAWKGISEDREFESAWGQATESSSRSRQKNLTELTEAITRIDDPKLQKSNFMQFMHKINRGQVSFKDNEVVEHEANGWAEEFQSTNRDTTTTTSNNSDWAKEFEDTFYHNPDYYNDDTLNSDFAGGDWAREYESFRGEVEASRLAEYEFALNEASNPYAGQSDVFEKGIDLFNQGMITESILAFEAEVLRDPHNSRAWQYLGQAHAENDKDNQAITCLEKAVQVDPQNLEALAALAVSYTNDFNREKALDALESWLKKKEEYAHIPHSASRPPPAEDFYMDAWSRHGVVADMYIEAARQRPEDPDPEVQTALGLLYNLSYEYDKAVDCFKAALTKRPNDYLLWNKLGATLANSNKSEEALGAYYRALEGKATYVRARANLGISFLALNEYPDAARSFLEALKLHPNAAHLWDNLKMVFRLMGREDLEERASNHNIEDFGGDVSSLF